MNNKEALKKLREVFAKSDDAELSITKDGLAELNTEGHSESDIADTAGTLPSLKSVEECAKADYFVAATKKYADQHPECVITGTKGGYFCYVCNEELILAPSGQKIAALGGVKPSCFDCTMKIAEAAKA